MENQDYDPEKDIINWDKAQKKNNIHAYEKYIYLTPNGKFIKEAEAILVKLKEIQQLEDEVLDDSMWQKAIKDNNYLSYFNYVTKFPKGKNIEKAKIKFAELKILRDAAKDEERKSKLKTLFISSSFLMGFIFLISAVPLLIIYIFKLGKDYGEIHQFSVFQLIMIVTFFHLIIGYFYYKSFKNPFSVNFYITLTLASLYSLVLIIFFLSNSFFESIKTYSTAICFLGGSIYVYIKTMRRIGKIKNDVDDEEEE